MAKYFDAWYRPEMSPKERFVFVGCVHQASPPLLARLRGLTAHPPDYLIFCGDVTGSNQMEDLKRLFYNYVYNRARRELGIGTPQAPDLTNIQLLDYVGPNPPEPGLTLRRGYYRLLLETWKLEERALHTGSAMQELIPDCEAADGIRHLARDFEYFGPWVKTLPEAVRRGVVASLETDAQALLATIQPLQQLGTEVHICAGNWDNAESTRENMAGEGVEVFDTIPFFRQHGVTFHETLGTLTTDRAGIVFAPYWELAHWNAESNSRLLQISRSCSIIDGTIIVVAHAEPNWLVHNLTTKNPLLPPGGDRAKVIDALNDIIRELEPDEVVYPHQHNPLVGETGQPVGLNAKYVLDYMADPVRLVTDPACFSDEYQTICTYLPYQRFGTLEIEKNDKNPVPKLFGGSRDPVFVS